MIEVSVGPPERANQLSNQKEHEKKILKQNDEKENRVVQVQNEKREKTSTSNITKMRKKT